MKNSTRKSTFAKPFSFLHKCMFCFILSTNLRLYSSVSPLPLLLLAATWQGRIKTVSFVGYDDDDFDPDASLRLADPGLCMQLEPSSVDSASRIIYVVFFQTHGSFCNKLLYVVTWL